MFRLHNIEIYLGLKNYLIKINDKEFKTIAEIIDYFKNNQEEFKEKVINHYLEYLKNIPDGQLPSIRDSFLEEILINVIAYQDPNFLRIVKSIYEELKERIEKNKGIIGIENSETAKNSIDEIIEELEKVEEYFSKLN